MSDSPENPNPKMTVINISVVPARDGYDWWRLSLRLFRMQWLRYCALAASFILIIQFSGAISGGLLAFFLKPILSVGFLAATWHHERGEQPTMRHLFAGFRSNVSALLPMGLVYLLGILVSVTIASYATGFDLRLLMEVTQPEQLPAETLSQFMLVTVACLLPVNAALWFAPALVVFSDVGLWRALMLSFQAWTRNIGAVAVYGLAMFGLALVAAIALSPVLILAPPSVRSVIMMIAVVPMFAVVFISDYVSYRRVFHRTERLQANDIASDAGASKD